MTGSYVVHPKFHVSTDCVIFGYENDELKLLLYPRRFTPSAGEWSLMGGFVQEHESLEMTSARVLKQTVGLENIYMEQVGGFSNPNRDPGDRVISMAFYALIRINEHDRELVNTHGARWWPITDLPELIFDHKEIVQLALEKLQQTASYKLIGKELLPELFTLTQLHSLYNAIFQRSFDAGNFRKKLASLNVLERTAVKETSTSKRGAYLFRFNPHSDSLLQPRIVKIN
jgi:8-oxo-dGTP diphosphatase